MTFKLTPISNEEIIEEAYIDYCNEVDILLIKLLGLKLMMQSNQLRCLKLCWE